jgi:hypothetical protein
MLITPNIRAMQRDVAGGDDIIIFLEEGQIRGERIITLLTKTESPDSG